MASSTCDGPGARRAARSAAAALAVPLALAAAGPLGAQAPLPPGLGDPTDADTASTTVETLPNGTRRVRGRVVTPRARDVAGVPGAWVTLHRVGRDTAGPIDSVRTDAAGAYAFTYRPRGDARAVYFASTMRGGVAYFGSPLTHAVVDGPPAELLVYDTTSAAGHVHVSGRHLIVSRASPNGTRDVLEVFELSNDSSVTFVPPAGSARGVWSTPLPAGAARFAVRESGDVPADGLTAAGGRVTLMTPVAPGIKQIAFSYALPAAAFPLALPVAPGTGVLEVLVEDPQGTAAGAGLAPVGPVALEGKSFQRFVAQNAAAGGQMTVAVGDGAAPDAAPRRAVPILLGVVGGAMAVALLVAGGRRRAVAPGPPPPAPVPAPAPVPVPAAEPVGASEREQLLAELVALDDAFARGPATDAARAEYEARRADVKARLAAELAGVGGGP